MGDSQKQKERRKEAPYSWPCATHCDNSDGSRFGLPGLLRRVRGVKRFPASLCNEREHARTPLPSDNNQRAKCHHSCRCRDLLFLSGTHPHSRRVRNSASRNARHKHELHAWPVLSNLERHGPHGSCRWASATDSFQLHRHPGFQSRRNPQGCASRRRKAIFRVRFSRPEHPGLLQRSDDGPTLLAYCCGRSGLRGPAISLRNRTHHRHRV